jgi:hypothetical protein
MPAKTAKAIAKPNGRRTAKPRLPRPKPNEEGENVQAHGLTGTLSSERRDDPAKEGLGHIVAKRQDHGHSRHEPRRRVQHQRGRGCAAKREPDRDQPRTAPAISHAADKWPEQQARNTVA